MSELSYPEAIESLARQLSPGQIMLLADLIKQLRLGSGYGDVRLVMTDQRIVLMKKEESYSCK